MEAQDGDAVAAPATVAPTSSGTANDLASEEPPVKRARTRSKPKRALTPPPPEPKRAVGRPRRSSVTKAAELAAARPAEPARAKRRPSRPRKVPSTTTDPSDGAPSTVSGDTSVLATPSPSETTPILPSPPPPTTESDVLMVAPSEASLPATQTDKATTEPALQSAPAGAQPLPDHNDDDDFSLAGTLSDVPSSSPSALSSPLSTTSPRHSRCRSQDSLSSLDSVRLERIASSRPRSMEHDVPADQIKLDAARDPSPVPEEPVDNSPSEKPAEVAPPPIVTPGTPHEAPTVKEPAVPATDMSADTDNLVTAEPMGPEVSEVNPESPPNSPLVELETKDAQDQGSPPPIKEEGDPGAHADVRAELNPEGNAEGGDGDDEEEEEEEATHHDPAARAKRQDALEVLSQIEVNFAKLREQLYAEKSAELAEELRLLEDEQHPELVEALDRLERRRTKAFKQARHWYDVRTGHNRAMYVSRVYSSHCTYDESKHKLRKTLLRHCEHQLRLASDEKRHLDQRIFEKCVPPASPGPITTAYAYLKSKFPVEYANDMIMTLTRQEADDDLRLIKGVPAGGYEVSREGSMPTPIPYIPASYQPPSPILAVAPPHESTPAYGHHPQAPPPMAPVPPYHDPHQPLPGQPPLQKPPAGYYQPPPSPGYVAHPPEYNPRLAAPDTGILSQTLSAPPIVTVEVESDRIRCHGLDFVVGDPVYVDNVASGRFAAKLVGVNNQDLTLQRTNGSKTKVTLHSIRTGVVHLKPKDHRSGL